ncbi:50S ribosomal protein L29 [Abditibacteriota bacterium]|nr:50S ribosomal protein L29 [Abditibacteriota bacterium]
MADLNQYISNADSKVKLYEVRERVKRADEAELRDILKVSERELFDLRTQAMLQQLPNPMRIRHVRKLIARVQTELSARQSQAA